MSDAPSVKTTFRLGLGVADGIDPDDEPDMIWCDGGVVRLIPVNTITKIPGGTPMPWTAGRAAIDVPVGPDGIATWNGQNYIKITDLTSTAVTPRVPDGKATHRVEYRDVTVTLLVNSEETKVTVEFPSTTVRLAADTVDPITGVCDLTKLTPVPTSGGTPITIGKTGKTPVIAFDTATSAPGTEASLVRTGGTDEEPEMLLTVPAGADGAPGGSDAAFAGWIDDTDSDTGKALRATIEAGVTTPERTQIQHRLAGTTEPGTFIAWTADDGYGSFADYFSLLSSKGIRGTLFLTQNWVGKAGIDPNWNDTYITQAQVQAIADAGHEIGTHAVNHEDMQTYLAEHGAAALDAMATASRDYVETTYGVPCRTGAYPGGSSNGLVREVIGRSHEYFRGTKGMVAHRGQDPFDVLAVDVQPLNEAQIKARVDEAYATGSLCVFLIHGIATADLPAALTKFGNVIDYATGLGIRHGTFYDGMRERTAVRGAAAYSLDTSGHLFARSVRTNRVTINRNDTGGDHAYLDVDETTNRPFFDATGGQPWEFRRPLEVAAGVNGTTLRVGQRVTVADGVTVNGSTTLTSATAGFKGFDVGRTVAGTGIPAGATIVSVQSPTSVTMSATATASVSGIVLTIGRPNELISIEGDTELWRGVKVHHANGVQFRGTNDDTDQGRITTSTWSRSGVGGPMTIDTGSGGSAFTIKAATAGLTDHAGAKKIRLSAAPPPDASITAGEVVLWFDSTNGAAKLQIKGKTADGTVVAGAVPLT